MILSRRITRPALSLLLAAATVVPPLVLAAASPAAATLLSWEEVQRNGVDGVDGLNGVTGVAVSPDGNNVYVVSFNDSALAVFSRDPGSGSLTFFELHRNGDGDVTGLGGARGVAVSPDGRHVYVASDVEDAMAVFERDPDNGALTFVASMDEGPENVNGLNGANAVTLSPDGNYIYVACDYDQVTVFSRDPGTGLFTLVQKNLDGQNGIDGLQRSRAVAVSPDGKNVYSAGADDDAVAVFARNATTGELTFLQVLKEGKSGVKGLSHADGVAVSPDGACVYAVGAWSDAIAVFSRDASTGRLTFVEEQKDDTNGVDGLNDPNAVSVSPDGTLVIATGEVDDAIAVFQRTPGQCALTFVELQQDNRNGVSGMNNPEPLAFSPNGNNLYVGAFVDDAVAVFRVPRCGDGNLDAGEQCDDGNNANGDCCSSTCRIDTDGTACEDGAFCTVGETCRAGACQGGTARNCAGAGNACNVGVCNEATDQCVAQPKPNGTSCSDGNACTSGDSCQAGACTGAPLVCTASDACHSAGVCNPSTGVCSNPAKPDGASCSDGSACTTGDTCHAGTCSGTAVVCAASDQCHSAGTCNPSNGVCSNPAKADGASCNDGTACTNGDVCHAGSCSGAPVICTASDQCHNAGVCNSSTGACSNPAKPDGATCNDGNACTQSDACSAGTCTGTDPVLCTAVDQCYDAGTCDRATGACSTPAKPDGELCDDGDPKTTSDRCVEGTCLGHGPGSPGDRDGDGIGDDDDNCPDIYNPGQEDTNHDGIGDACECTSPAPGHCVGGGGAKKGDCLVEFNTPGPVNFNKKRTLVRRLVRCIDGDSWCDRDGVADGQCTFGISVCLANDDPRYPKCTPSDVVNFEVVKPDPAANSSTLDQTNALALEQALGGLGLEIRRRGVIVAGAGTLPTGNNVCSALTNIVVPAPAAAGGKPVRKRFRVRGVSADQRKDSDRLILECYR